MVLLERESEGVAVYVHDGAAKAKKVKKLECFNFQLCNFTRSSLIPFTPQHLKRGSSTNLTQVQTCKKRKIFKTLKFRCIEEKY